MKFICLFIFLFIIYLFFIALLLYVIDFVQIFNNINRKNWQCQALDGNSVFSSTTIQQKIQSKFRYCRNIIVKSNQPLKTIDLQWIFAILKQKSITKINKTNTKSVKFYFKIRLYCRNFFIKILEIWWFQTFHQTNQSI